MQRKRNRAIAFLFALFLAFPMRGADKKLTAEELVACHLDSIGTPEARANLKSRLLKGQGFLRILLGGSGGLQGRVTHASEGNKSSFFFEVGHPSYQGEQMMSDGRQVWVAPAFTGKRSEMGEFVHTYSHILREGLLGGTISTGWAMLELDSKKPKLSYRGLRKVNDRKLHRLEYRPKKPGGDLRIDLYFEPDTFRHVQTTYRLTLPAQMGLTSIESARQEPTYYLLEEIFEDFRKIDGLTLPVRWKIRFSRTGQPSSLWEWEMVFQSATHNQPIDPDSFRPR